MSLDRLKFTKTLKFKLTLWYSLLLSVFSIILVLSMNVWLSNYMKSNIALPSQGYWGRVMEQRPRFRNLTDEQIELIMQSRLADLDNIRTITLYSIAPLILLSFVGGYSIASLGLRPLEELSIKMKNKSTENLGEEIKFVDNGDEISQLIKSFNRMSRRLNTSFKTQKEFVENASHELKTPLAVIQANLDTALDDKKISKKELTELLESSKKSIEFMNKLTEDLLLLSVLEHKADVEKVNLNNLLKTLIKESKTLLKGKKLNIELVDNCPNCFVKGNEVLFKRAFMNIIENAIKYSGSSKITIKLSKSNEGEVSIIIEDNGEGIPKKDINRIFDRFYRVEKSRSRKTGGSGLGLSITKEIIESYGGRISVVSELRIGSKFTIRIPSF
jgi:two-component system, OmpR family, sensor histidine kinase ArlS